MSATTEESDSSHLPAPAELLQKLIRFNTTNPPGDEAECITFISNLLRGAGIEPTIVARTPNRANLVARLKGQGNAAPLLLYGHVDVVTTSGQQWTHPPFEGALVDGYIWGRGALDMKGGVAMLISAFLRANAENISLPGDVILAIVSDEEAGGDYGAKYLVQEHADLFKGVRYALGEFGGFTLTIAGQKFYPIMISEKQVCWMEATFRGPGGHGSSPLRGGAMAKLSKALAALDRNALPIHVTSESKLMIESMARGLKFPANLLLGQLANPALASTMLKLLGDNGKLFAPLLRNTASPTILRGGDKINVHPSQISLQLDGRLLPGFKPEDMVAELGALLGPDVELRVIQHDPGPAKADMGLFETLGQILRAADPAGIPIPLVLAGVTDARFFSQIGIQTYGFLPMQLPTDFKFVNTIHAADERIPVESLEFGTRAILRAMEANQ